MDKCEHNNTTISVLFGENILLSVLEFEYVMWQNFTLFNIKHMGKIMLLLGARINMVCNDSRFFLHHRGCKTAPSIINELPPEVFY